MRYERHGQPARYHNPSLQISFIVTSGYYSKTNIILQHIDLSFQYALNFNWTMMSMSQINWDVDSGLSKINSFCQFDTVSLVSTN
jgi:hypothetical protein